VGTASRPTVNVIDYEVDKFCTAECDGVESSDRRYREYRRVCSEPILRLIAVERRTRSVNERMIQSVCYRFVRLLGSFGTTRSVFLGVINWPSKRAARHNKPVMTTFP